METQAHYLPCFAASDPVFPAEECRKILAIGQAGRARAEVMQSTAGSGRPVYERGPDRDSAVTFFEPGARDRVDLPAALRGRQGR